MTEHEQFEKDYEALIELTIDVLVTKFKKTQEEAKSLIEETDLRGSMREHPLALHDSPHCWALVVLTTVEDIEAIEKYELKEYL